MSRAASVLAMGAAALMMWAPIAGADDPPPCEPNDQQCQQQKQQNPGAGIANEVIDNVQQGLDQVKQQPTQPSPPNGGSPVVAGGTGLFMLVDGVPTCVPFGTAPPLTARLEPPPGQTNVGSC